MFLLELIKKHKIIAGISLLMFIIVGMIIFNIFNIKRSDSPANPDLGISKFLPSSNQNNTFSSLQKTVPGKTTVQDVERTVPRILKKDVLPGGGVQYSFQSELISRPNQIQTKNGVAVFEKELIPENPSARGYVLISTYINSLGKPEKIIKGSNFYGWSINTYVYPNKGFAFIGNPNTDEVLEIHIFKPLSVEDYVKMYGEDINQNLQLHNDDPISNIYDVGSIIKTENFRGVQKREVLKDGRVKYVVESINPARPDIFITDKSGIVVYKRTIAPNSSVSLTEFVKLYGQAKWIFKGSVFYGVNSVMYIYADRGFAFVASSQSNVIQENISFIPMRIEDYVNKYGDDIPTQP